jgi:hypothetical protein
MALRFGLGSIVATPGVLNAFVEAGITPAPFVVRHAACDWGDLCAEDKQLNDAALKHGTRLLSAYHLPTGVKIYIITEADRSVTTLLLPEEY